MSAAVTAVTAVKVALADIAPTRRQGGELRVLLAPATVGATAGFMGALSLAPGEHVAEHYHPYSDEFLFVVQGELVVSLDGTDVDLGSNESLMVRRGARHRVTNVGSSPAFVVFHIGPLAPRPELGHVDTEAPPHPHDAVPTVG